MTNISRQDCSKFVGTPYAAADCVDLLIDVQRRLFGREFDLPTDRNQWRRQARELLRTHVDPVEIPHVGDLVVMRDFMARYPGHVGTYFEFAGDAWVLHTTERTDAVFHRIRQLSTISIIVEGYYRWKTP